MRDTAARWALCCNFCEPCFQSYPTAVRGMLVLTVLESAGGFLYSLYIIAIVLQFGLESREELFGAGFLAILGAALVLFVITAVKHENSFELAAANLISASLCLGPLLILFKQPDGAGWGTIVEVTKSVDSGARMAFMIVAVAFGVCFAGVSVVVQREFAWKLFLVHGEQPEKMKLSQRLQRWACLWKIDVVFNILCLLAAWAFLFAGWTQLQVFGGCVAVLSTLFCSAAVRAATPASTHGAAARVARQLHGMWLRHAARRELPHPLPSPSPPPPRPAPSAAPLAALLGS